MNIIFKAAASTLHKKPRNTKERISRLLLDIEHAGLYPKHFVFHGSTTRPETNMDGKPVLMFGSNNYLGLANEPSVIERAKSALEIHGMGPGGSRNLSGNIDYLEEFERELADFAGTEDAITFPTGYMANMSIFQAIMGPSLVINPFLKSSDGVIFSDEHNHATLVDGCRLSNAKKVIYKHNSLSDLEKKLKSEKHACKMVVTESVFSTEGLLTDVPEFIKLARKYNALIMVDDAHGVGVLGKHGGGVIKHFGLTGENAPDIVMASFDKALGTIGSYIGGSKELIKYLRIAARPYMFSSTMPVVVAAATWAVIDHLKEHPETIVRARTNAEYVRDQLKKNGIVVLGNTKTPVVPVLVGSDEVGIQIEDELQNMGIYVPCFRYPAAPMGKSRLRVAIMATHTQPQLDKLVHSLVSLSNKYKMAHENS